MSIGRYSRFTKWQATLYIGLTISVVAHFVACLDATPKTFAQERQRSRPDSELEIILPDSAQRNIKLPIRDGERSMTLIYRSWLRISDPGAAAGVTAVDVWADGGTNEVSVRLSIIYNDLSNREWWKEKKERILGSFVVPEGGSLRVAELTQFGIEPFEMKATNAKPVFLPPGDGFRLINDTESLDVVEMVKSLDRYELWLKNKSSKNVVAYSISAGGSVISVHGGGVWNRGSVIGPGETFQQENLPVRNLESSSLRIQTVVFDDDSFEGDAELAAQFVALREGIRMQSTSILKLIDQTLEQDDAALLNAFDKLETQLGVLPEAISKPSALELLKAKYPDFPDGVLGGLYEDLKRGLYEGKNMAHIPMGRLKRELKALKEEPTPSNHAIHVKVIREKLIEIKRTFGEVAKTS